MILPLGAIINAIAVVIGSLIGLAFSKVIPEKLKIIVIQAIGLCTLLIGFQSAFKTDNLLAVIFSMIIGGLIGEGLEIEMKLEKLANKLKVKFKQSDDKFTEGLITAFLIYCIGSMTIVGSISEGVSGDRTLIYTKSLLDGFTAIALSASLGIGVLISAVPLLLFQGSLTILASILSSFFTTHMINQLTATGGLLIIGIGLNLLDIKKLKVINLLPALLIVAIISFFV